MNDIDLALANIKTEIKSDVISFDISDDIGT